jgi:hypothetical protein
VIAAFNPAWLVIPGLLAMFVGVVWAARAQAQKTREKLHAFAQRNGLRVQEQTVLGFTSVQSFEGEQSGRAIRYWTYATGSGKSRTNWVTVGVRPRGDGGMQFDLSRQNLGTKIMEMFGAREVRVGDPVFDEAWFVRTNQPEYFKVALMPEMQAKLMAAPTGRWGVRYKLEAGWVQYVEQGHLGGTDVVERLEKQLPLLHELADVAEVFASSPGR